MALLYFVNITNPNDVDTLPPSLRNGSYGTKLTQALASTPSFSSKGGSYVQLFADQAALTAYANTLVLTSEENTALTEWKTANSITISYEVFDLPTASGATVPTPYGN
jgi:hypothetical protein